MLGPQARLSRIGPLYYLFGAPHSAACASAPGRHCLLAGPVSTPRELPASAGERLTIAQGTVVLQAAAPSAGRQTPPSSPAARFYVLHDDVSLSDSEITHPHPSTDQSGSPEVAFDFTASGGRAFQKVTAAIAHRGSLVSTAGAPAQNQHFAIALDGRLLTVPFIDFRTNPDGVAAGGGADLLGGFTRRSAGELSTLLRSGPLPVDLVSIR